MYKCTKTRTKLKHAKYKLASNIFNCPHLHLPNALLTKIAVQPQVGGERGRGVWSQDEHLPLQILSHRLQNVVEGKGH